jgi:site-specific recombinase
LKKLPARDLSGLLAALDPQADLAQRHLWLIELFDWLRGDRKSVEATLSRVRLFQEALEADPAAQERMYEWWRLFVQSVDLSTLMADFGFAPRTAFLSELSTRLRMKLLPSTPETVDASELFVQVFPSAFDAQWLDRLDAETLAPLMRMLTTSPEGDRRRWQEVVLDAITYCSGQILATGFAPELRQRMSESALETRPFHALIRDVDALRAEVLHAQPDPQRVEQAMRQLRERLDACRAAAASIYTHFEDNGISVGLVFRLRQLRERIVRVRELLDCLRSATPSKATAQLLAGLVTDGRDRTSVRALVASNSSLLAAKVAERSAETGEHYITRNGSEYLSMVRKAAGGGALMAFTTLVKFGLYALALSAFWGGFMAGVNYALSFVLVQLLHFTVATKQPAMTAPAMAAKLKELHQSDGVENFVDKVTDLVRTQAAAILGNVLVVFPVVIGLSMLLAQWLGHPVISEAQATHTLDTLHLLGPSVLFAAFTGVLLFASSIIAGWTENWFVLNRLDSAIHYNPRITLWLGKPRAARWARFMRENISGLAANISLGFMLGLTPAFAGFFGLGLDVRHVTLASGQVGVASTVLGWEVLHQSAFWWAVVCLPLLGALNVTVSFYLAFRLALRAHNVSGVDRSRIYAAIRSRLRTAPLSFIKPLRRSQ